MISRATCVFLLIGIFASGMCAGIGVAFAWLLAVDLQLGFEVIGSRVLECLTR
jgi:hypothetical protein